MAGFAAWLLAAITGNKAATEAKALNLPMRPPSGYADLRKLSNEANAASSAGSAPLWRRAEKKGAQQRCGAQASAEHHG